MNEREPNFSRRNRKKGRGRANSLLNISIAVVLVFIIVITFTILNGGDDTDSVNETNTNESEIKDENENEIESTEDEVADEAENEESEEPTEETDEPNKDTTTGENDDESIETDETEDGSNDGLIVTEPSSEEVVKETVIDPTWQPVTTEQTGEHVPSYDGESLDWSEKRKAIAYATGDSVEDLIYWKIKNGGSPQKSIGIVESKTNSEKYRVYIEWVDGKGWKPVKKDILTTLDFDY